MIINEEKNNDSNRLDSSMDDIESMARSRFNADQDDIHLEIESDLSIDALDFVREI